MNNSKFIGGGGSKDVVNCDHNTHKKMPHSIWRILDFLNENCCRKQVNAASLLFMCVLVKCTMHWILLRKQNRKSFNTRFTCAGALVENKKEIDNSNNNDTEQQVSTH